MGIWEKSFQTFQSFQSALTEVQVIDYNARVRMNYEREGCSARCARLAALKPLSCALRALVRRNAFAADDSGVSSNSAPALPKRLGSQSSLTVL